MAKHLISYDPTTLFNDFESFINGLYAPAKNGDDTKVATSRWLPAVDIREENNRFIIHADLPGVDTNDIDVSMENNILTLKGSRQTEEKKENASYYRVERTRGAFYRRFSLPDTADGENIKASMNKGVLEIIIPKKEIAKTKKIEVTIND